MRRIRHRILQTVKFTQQTFELRLHCTELPQNRSFSTLNYATSVKSIVQLKDLAFAQWIVIQRERFWSFSPLKEYGFLISLGLGMLFFWTGRYVLHEPGPVRYVFYVAKANGDLPRQCTCLFCDIGRQKFKTGQNQT